MQYDFRQLHHDVQFRVPDRVPRHGREGLERWGLLEDAKRLINQGTAFFVEGYMHEVRAAARAAERVKPRRREAHPMPAIKGYRPLDAPRDGPVRALAPLPLARLVLPERYLAVSREWGLNYTLEDFRDPNQGAGPGCDRAARPLRPTVRPLPS